MAIPTEHMITYFHVASKADWWTIGDDLPQFEDAHIRR